MTTFEEFGNAVDREIEKLKKFFHEDFSPNAKRGAVDLLRTTADRLNELAGDLEHWGETKSQKPSP
jgi:hypothetical protein